MKIAQGTVLDLNAPPNRRLHADQCNLELEEKIRLAARSLAGLGSLQAEYSSFFLLEELRSFLLYSKQPFFVRAESIVGGLPGFFVQFI